MQIRFGKKEAMDILIRHTLNSMTPSGLRVIFQRQTRKSPRREAERTMTYVSIHDGGFDAVSR